MVSKSIVKRLAIALTLVSVGAVTQAQPASTGNDRFTIAVLPDTQNYLDFTHQKSYGFALDAGELFLQQMRYIAGRSRSNGGDIVFVSHLGDVWQHQTKVMDPQHAADGFKSVPNKWIASKLKVAPEEVYGFEMPLAVEGFRVLAEAGLPFGVVPGNHDFDAMWSAAGWTPVEERKDIRMTPEALGMVHAGGLENFRTVFGNESEFFKGQPWYVASHDGGTSSAQIFKAGGYRFLHLSLDMSPTDSVLAWASEVIAANPGLPTIVTTHDYLNPDGERLPNPIVDFNAVDPRHNSAEMLWQKFVSRHEQIFMVLSGHQRGQSLRVDQNNKGQAVYQILADYQDRGQAGIDAGQPLDRYTGKPEGIGDGWMRLMEFDLSGDAVVVRVKTWSSHYRVQSTDLESYARWYRHLEQPAMSDADFVEADDYSITLKQFRQRYGAPN